MAVTAVITPPVLQKAERCQMYQDIGGSYKVPFYLLNSEANLYARKTINTNFRLEFSHCLRHRVGTIMRLHVGFQANIKQRHSKHLKGYCGPGKYMYLFDN